ncbi:transient receptor potential cation channel trpm-like [Limulus polyphemus]|uniref:Transient receptor potential cation channel trpm-like n=1 Tax=Limulus polyphemus TaxID=6850 RepID=A0ABM1TI59_LIMPO|nr:transient receptor potential cation channel trpm-like [Limulus polyphemus]
MSNSQRMTHAIRCIGIAKWGFVEGRNALINRNVHEPYTAMYKVNPVFKQGKPAALNPNHTHFLLIDDGFSQTFRGIEIFRTELEQRIAAPLYGPDPGLGIPVVLLLLEGGFDAISHVHMAITCRIPVVICAGTGRSADILAYAYNSSTENANGDRVVSDFHRTIIEKMLIEACEKTFQLQQQELKAKVSLILNCCRDENLITIFDIDSDEELDSAILVALMKGKGCSHRREQLQLALKWNRVDLASQLFTSQVFWPPGCLEDSMTEALVMDRVEFVKLLLLNGVVMKDYLTVGRLRHLYNACIFASIYYLLDYILMEKSKRNSHPRLLVFLRSVSPTVTDNVMLWDIHLLLRHLMRMHNWYYYSDKTKVVDHLPHVIGSAENFDKPFRELFLWAVFLQRKEMAVFLWKEAVDALNLALAATCIYWKISKAMSIHDDLLRSQLLSFKKTFEQIAIQHINQCYSMDRDKAVELIETSSTYWGGMSALDIALSANDLEFISTPCCQQSISQAWSGGLATSSSVKVNLALFNPFLIWTYLKFWNEKTTKKPPGFFAKARIFYTAPITKFFYYLYSYIGFLALFSYVILFEFHETAGFFELVLHVWALTLVLEEVREIVTYPSERKLHKLRDWFQEYFWNKVDAACIVLSLVGVLLRTTQQVIGSHYFLLQVDDVHLVMTISCALFYIRLFKCYMVSFHLGPKLVIIKRMLVEVVLFLLILLIFILSYGVASQALLKRNRQPFLGIFREVFYLPYWQLYGELNLDRLEDFYYDCSREKSDCSDSPHAWLVPVMLGVYMLLGNVLLVNLLIAVFSHVFEEVNKHSQEIWRYEMALIVAEYTRKPTLLPPFVILEHTYLVISWLCNKIRSRYCSKGLKDVWYHSSIMNTYAEHQSFFEKEGKAKFLKGRSSEETVVENLILKCQKKIDDIQNSVNETKHAILLGIVHPSMSSETAIGALPDDETSTTDQTKTYTSRWDLVRQTLRMGGFNKKSNFLADVKVNMAKMDQKLSVLEEVENRLSTLEHSVGDIIHHMKIMTSKFADIEKSLTNKHRN